MSSNNLHNCKRCGYCCLSGCCSRGIESSKTSVCKFLKINDDMTTSCAHVDNGDSNGISIGLGCVLQSIPDVYSYYAGMYEKEKLNLKYQQ